MNQQPGRVGRPRSEAARTAVLHAVDDLLVEQGYAALTMKGIAERAGVSRQTVYRWWSTKAEILAEASAVDAAQELAVPPAASPLAEVTAYLDALVVFLTTSEAGAAYRALLGEAQHDADVARLVAERDVVGDAARTVVERAVGADALGAGLDEAVARLVGPTFYWVLSGRDAAALDTGRLAAAFLREVGAAVRQPAV